MQEQLFKCKVCGQDFKDGWEHSLKQHSKEYPFLVPIDKEHSEALEKIKGKMSFNCPFCDTKVNTISVGFDGWITECRECNYLFDED